MTKKIEISALTGAIIVALIGLAGTLFGTALQGRSNLVLEEQKFQFGLIAKAFETGDIEQQINYLRFLRNSKLVPRLDAVIDTLVKNQDRIPFIPFPETASGSAFAVVASFASDAAAVAYARQLSNQGVEYDVEVYKRDTNRYAVTLGGYLTREEANRRIEYAKQSGFMDRRSYVRIAGDWGDNLFGSE